MKFYRSTRTRNYFLSYPFGPFTPRSARTLLAGLVTAILLAACQTLPNDEATAPIVSAKPTARELTSVQEISEPAGTPLINPVTPADVGNFTNLWDRIRQGLELQEFYSNPAVQQEASWYAENQRFFDRVVNRAQPFLFEIVKEVEARGMPLEVALIPVVESAFNSQAYSSEHAVGLWQFMRATGHSFGLSDDWWYDGRRDPLAATRAALDYLELLHKQFDEDWLLAMAAYNTGEGNILRAIRRNTRSEKATDFWSLRIARETQKHVPRILAISSIVANAAAFDIELMNIDNAPYLESVDVGSQIDLNLAASLAGIDAALLKQLNPGYRQWATHPDGPQNLLIPLTHSERFKSELALLPADRRVTWDRYEIRPGDNLGSIARNLGTRVDILQTVNGLRGSRIIAGRSLLVPRTNDAELLAATPVPVTRSNSATPAPQRYTVRSGDNLWSIARRYGLKSADIASLNNISLNSTLMPGQALQLVPSNIVAVAPNSSTDTPAAIPDSHRVIRGDSLDRIARRYKLEVSDLLEFNELQLKSVIYPGQQIKLR